MFAQLKKLFSSGPKVNFGELAANGAVIIDVRSKSEYLSGHIKGSVNIPLDTLSSKLGSLKDKNKTIITCCASGMRSASAKGVLQSKGYTDVHNGGGWYGLQQKINKSGI